MKFLFLLFLATLSPIVSLAQEKILWSEQKLTWKDFNRRTGPPAFYKAFTYSGIRFSLDQKDEKVTIEIEAYFNPKESWVQKDNEKPELLVHEQIHFDITELHARKIRQALVPFVGMDIHQFVQKEHSTDVQLIYDKLNVELSDVQNKYDSETNHGIDFKKQADWLAKIETDLLQLEEFKAEH